MRILWEPSPAARWVIVHFDADLPGYGETARASCLLGNQDSKGPPPEEGWDVPLRVRGCFVDAQASSSVVGQGTESDVSYMKPFVSLSRFT